MKTRVWAGRGVQLQPDRHVRTPSGGRVLLEDLLERDPADPYTLARDVRVMTTRAETLLVGQTVPGDPPAPRRPVPTIPAPTPSPTPSAPPPTTPTPSPTPTPTPTPTSTPSPCPCPYPPSSESPIPPSSESPIPPSSGSQEEGGEEWHGDWL